MKKQKEEANCESCLYYDYDETVDAYICTVSLDEDELLRFLEGNTKSCPYYRYFDEYKSVQKQN